MKVRQQRLFSTNRVEYIGPDELVGMCNIKIRGKGGATECHNGECPGHVRNRCSFHEVGEILIILYNSDLFEVLIPSKVEVQK
jgi:hypothetical protein